MLRIWESRSARRTDRVGTTLNMGGDWLCRGKIQAAFGASEDYAQVAGALAGMPSRRRRNPRSRGGCHGGGRVS